tara:strand:- start:386 stop:1063 length:678 start_codon:yes stop_codon:yes gene_type:complete
VADLILPRGEQKVLKAEDKDYNRGLLVKLLDNGGYDMAYWYNKPDKPYPVEVLVDGKSIKKDAKVVEMKFHPKDYYDKVEENTMEEARGSCWVGYKQIGMKDKGGKKVPNCVKENVELYYEENGKGYGYTFEFITDKSLQEAEYQGRKVKLNKIMQGDQKKFKVYVKNPKGNVVKVNFGQGGKAKGGTMRIRKSNPGARKSFRARHNCDNPGPKHKARYWACRTW